MRVSKGSSFTLGLVFLLLSNLAQAKSWVRASESFMEQGDYILHPGLQLSFDHERQTRVRLDFTGRRFGSFLETTTMLSWDESWQIFPWPSVTSHYGLSLLDEYTAYEPRIGAKQSAHNVNLGVNLGLGWKIWQNERWGLGMEWNSHIFPAGWAIVLLTTARKSIFTLGVEVML